MKPESIETYRGLKQKEEEIKQELLALREIVPPIEVENLSPGERIDRLAGLIKQFTVNPTEDRSIFGAKVSYRGNTLPRIVCTPSGEEYKVYLSVHTSKLGFGNPERIFISAEWDKCVARPEDTYSYNEYIENGWVDSNPTLPRGLMILSNLEWSLEAYLNGTIIEDQ